MRPIPFAMLLTLLAAGALLPQQKPQPPKTPQQAVQPSNGPAKFSAGTTLVVETVFIKDKDGKTIEGLTAKDFTVTEDNTPQEIRFCEFQKLDDTVAPPIAEAAPTIPAAQEPEKPKADPITRVQIQPEVPGDIRYRDKRLLALYFDMSAMPVPDQLRSLDAAAKFIRTQMKTADMMAIIQYDGEAVRVLQDFTANRDDLMKCVNKLVIGEGSGLDELLNDAATSDTGSAFGEDDSEFNLFNTNRQLAALQSAVKMLGALNEKKVLIYFASGLQLNGVDNQSQFQATTNAAIRANVTFWSIDARGLVAMAPMGDATRGSAGGLAMYSGAAALANTSRFQKSQDTLFALATDTGGKALLDNNDLAKGVQDAEASISSYYIIGYYTTNQNLDGKFRRIKIGLKENTLAKLDYRQGYYANKTFNKFTSADKERQLQDALMLGDPMTEINIAMEVNYFQLNSAEYFTPLVMKIPGSELALARKGGAERTLIDFIGEVKDEYGTTVANVRDKVDMKLSGATAAQLAHQPIEYDTAFTLLPGQYTIKVLARDDETGRIGTYMKKFTIPNLLKEQQKIPISSVVLSGQRIDMRDALFTAGKDKGPQVNPLVQDGLKLLPSVNRVFSKSRDMYVYLQAYERGTETMKPLVAYVTFYRGQSKAFETPALGVTEGMDPKSKAVPLRFSLALAKLPPGRYDCQVTVVDPASQKAAFWNAPVLLVQ
ncbi:MAG TPA: VWA domain-containing protein [Bryobacteraceae bacterium]|nr:VWA domain-containing protein [Bryobacteraceae bacterium]